MTPRPLCSSRPSALRFPDSPCPGFSVSALGTLRSALRFPASRFTFYVSRFAPLFLRSFVPVSLRMSKMNKLATSPILYVPHPVEQ